MNKASLCLFGGALIGAGLTSYADAGAQITIDGTLSLTDLSYYDEDEAEGTMAIDVWNFTVISDGYVQIDLLSYDFFSSYFDGAIWLFENDGNPFSYAGNYVYSNDDMEDVGDDLNGSVDSLDSFLDIFLTAGEYSVAVGHYTIDIDEINAGESFGRVIDPQSETGPIFGIYQLDIYGDVALVPAPTTLALLGFGALATTRRRR